MSGLVTVWLQVGQKRRSIIIHDTLGIQLHHRLPNKSFFLWPIVVNINTVLILDAALKASDSVSEDECPDSPDDL